MNPIDVCVFVGLLTGGVRGYWRGLVREVLTLVALIGGTWGAVRFNAPLATVLDGVVPLPPPLPSVAAFLVIFVATYLVFALVGFLFGGFPEHMLGRVALGIGGMLMGMGKAAMVSALALLLLHVAPLAPKVEALMVESRVARPLIAIARQFVRVTANFDLPTEPPARG